MFVNMKIGEINQPFIPGVTEWVSNLKSLDDAQFLAQLSHLTHWEWQRLQDLSPLAPVLDRLDTLLDSSLQSRDFPTQKFLMDKTLLLLQSSASKSLYSSVDKISKCLDSPDIQLVYITLQVIQVLITRINSSHRNSQTHRNKELTHKLYVLAVGTNLCNQIPVSLVSLCQEQVGQFPMCFFRNGEPSFDLPQEMLYIALHRDRTNQALKSEKEVLVACQFLSLSCLLQISADSKTISDFLRTTPQIWLLPCIPELLRVSVWPEVHAQIIQFLSSVFLFQDRPSTNAQVVEAVVNLLAAWQQHGLVQTLLRDITAPSLLPAQSVENQKVVAGILSLAQVIADYRFRTDPSHVTGMTGSLLELLQLPYKISLQNLASAGRVLTVLVSHNIGMFKEANGTQTVLSLLIHQIQQINQDQSRIGHLGLVKVLFRLLSTAIAKWESVPGTPNSQIRVLMDSSLILGIKQIFDQRCHQVYDGVLQLLITMLTEQISLIPEFVEQELIRSFLEALQCYLPPQPKLITLMVRLLCAIALNIQGVKSLQNLDIIPNIVQTLGTAGNSVLSSDAAIGIGQSLQELIRLVPSYKQKAIQGCLNLLFNIQNSEITDNKLFFMKLNNAGRLLQMVLSFSNQLVKKFFDQGGLQAYLAIFKIPIMPKAHTNQFHSVLSFFKSIPQNLAGQALAKVLVALNEQLISLADITGGLENTKNFVDLDQQSEQRALYILMAIDSYIQMARMVVQFGAAVAANIDEFLNTIFQLAQYTRILISQQARISVCSQNSEKLATKFVVQIDLEHFQNAETKTFKENFLFSCQWSVRKFLRQVSRIPGARSRQNVPQDIGIRLTKAVAEILCGFSQLLVLDSEEPGQVFYLCLQLSDLVKILLHEQGAYLPVVYCFVEGGGVDNIASLINSLKGVSSSLFQREKLPYYLVNSIQILWNLCGRVLEGLAVGKFGNSNTGGSLLKLLGVGSAKEVTRQLQILAVSHIKRLNFLECGLFSPQFGKSVLEAIKQLGDLNKDTSLDQTAVSKVVQMGFPEPVARQALMNIGSSSVQMATEWILSHPEVLQNYFDEDVSSPTFNMDNLYQILINSITRIPSLHPSFSEILINICNKDQMAQADIALMLLTLIGKLGFELFGESSLVQIMEGMSSLEPINLTPTQEQFRSVLSILSNLLQKSPDVFEIVKNNEFVIYACKYLERQRQDQEFEWAGQIFGIIEQLVKPEQQSTSDIIDLLGNVILRLHKKLSAFSLSSLVRLLVRVTFQTKHAQRFLNTGALKTLLLAKPDQPQPKGYLENLSALLYNLTDDPVLFRSTAQNNLLKGLAKDPQPLQTFISNFSKFGARNPTLFKQAIENACLTYKSNELILVKPNPNRQEISGEHWRTVSQVAQSLVQAYKKQQQGNPLLLGCGQLMKILSDLLQDYPVLINQLLSLSVTVTDGITKQPVQALFLSHLIRNIIPFRYRLQIQDGKIRFFQPCTRKPVSPDVFQDWVKVSAKLLKVFLFKQTKSPVQQSVRDQKILDNNQPVVRARLKIFREMQLIFQTELEKGISRAENMNLVRTMSILTMQILRETSRNPFAKTNQAQIAKLLISEDLNFISLLSGTVKSVNITSETATSFLNLVLAPLQLLLRYNISFTLHSSKAIIPIEEPNSSSQQEEGSIQMMPGDQNFPQDDILDEFEDEQSLNMILQSRNTEAFWADNFEQEQEPRDLWGPPRYNLMPQRDLIIPGLDFFNRDQPHILPFSSRALRAELLGRPELFGGRYRFFANRPGQDNLFETRPPLLRDLDEYGPNIMQFIREMHASEDQVLNELLQRQNRQPVQRPPRVPEVPQNLFDDLIIDLAQNAQNEPQQVVQQVVNEVEQPVLPQEIQPVVQQEKQEFIPEGIDPQVFRELPEELRAEIMAQYNPPAQEQNVSEQFLLELPEDLRAQVMGQYNPPPQAQEIDNASFITSLPPDLRREILITADQEVLSTLPPDLAAEARVLQERLNHRNHHLLNRGREQQRKQVQEENKIVAEFVNEEKQASALIPVDDSFLEYLCRALYLYNPINRDILASVMLNISASNQKAKLLDGLISILVNQKPHGGLPHYFLSHESYFFNYELVYAIVSSRILDLLQYIVSLNPKISQDLLKSSVNRLMMFSELEQKPTHFIGLISLLQSEIFRKSHSHLTPLISLLATVLSKCEQEIPELERPAIIQLCSLLSYQSLNDQTVSTVMTLVEKLAKTDSNRREIQQALSLEVQNLAQQLASSVQILQTSYDGSKQTQLLRLYRVLKGIKGQADLSCLWTPLTQALNTIRESLTDLASTTDPTLSKLMPIIQTFFLAHTDFSATYQFSSFCQNNRKVINLLVKQNLSLLHETFHSILTHFSYLIDFQNKRSYFRSELRKLRPEGGYGGLKLSVRRTEVFMDSFHQLKVRTPVEMYGKLRVQFVGEEGMDAGGLTREWFGTLAREMFNPNYALFIPSANGVSFQPNSLSGIHQDHLQYFKFVGRIIGKAICDGQHIDVYFTRSFYKHILGQEVTVEDLEDLDPEIFKSLKILRELDLNDPIHQYYFVHQQREFGKITYRELVPQGRQIRVTQDNKNQYVTLLCRMMMTQNIKQQINSFLEGFYEIVPKEIIGIFDSKELELLISGLPEIDLDDLKANTDYHSYTQDSPTIQYLWETLHEFTQEERAEFLQFVTGSSKVPLEGFKALQGMGGVQKFQIHKSYVDINRLPTSHTCMNQLDLPEYPTKEVLKNRLKIAISEGKEGFGFI